MQFSIGPRYVAPLSVACSAMMSVIDTLMTVQLFYSKIICTLNQNQIEIHRSDVVPASVCFVYFEIEVLIVICFAILKYLIEFITENNRNYIWIKPESMSMRI